jgi:tetratricopeptide (TPR) repeat protein
MADGTAKPVIFISYSHKDEPEHPRDGEVQWLSFVRTYLQPAIKNGIFDIFVDEHLPGGADLKLEIERKLRACDVFILLISANSTSSDYIVDTEIKVTRDRESKGADVCFYPVLLTPTPKVALDKFKDKVIRPKDAKPLSSFPYAERIQKMTEIADEIAEIAAKIVSLKPEPPRRGPQPSYVHISGLPETPYERLVGRDVDLKRLDDAWTDEKTNVLSLIADGGAGKSALVNEWLKRLQADNYRGTEAVLGWSFYSQGSKERATSADEFFDWALEKLSVKLETTSATAKGEAVAEAMTRRRVLLVLDGVEPLQHGLDTQLGQLKDQGLRALLRHFAATPPSQAHGLIVLTSRLAVKDIDLWQDGAAPVVDIDRLPDEAGAALLRDNGIWGTDKELKAAAQDFGGHPLALGLLASFLKETQAGDVRRHDHIRGLLADTDNPGHDHARRVMESIEKEWLAEQPVLLAIMHMVGLFDRPASSACFKALRAEPAIIGLTDRIVTLDESEWQRAVARLREVRLLAPADLSTPDTLDAHPLVREWFGERLRETNEAAWKAAHSRLYGHLRDTTKEGETPTLKDLAPLYQAIAHACRAGRYEESLRDIFDKRLRRSTATSNAEAYTSHQLGAHGSNLAALNNYFERAYDIPVSALSLGAQGFVFNAASFALRAFGRFSEALPTLQAGLKVELAQADYSDLARARGSIAQVKLVTGHIQDALDEAKKATTDARKGPHEDTLVFAIAVLGDALHQAGRRRDARRRFEQSETLQKKLVPLRYLGRVSGFHFCELLMQSNEWQAAKDRASYTIEISRDHGWGMIEGLERLVLSRVSCHSAIVAASFAGNTTSKISTDIEFRECLEILRARWHSEYIPRGLLARAAFYLNVADWDGAARDLDEIAEIAEPGPMRLFLCDMALERARLAFARIEAFAPLNGMLEKDNPPKPTVPSAKQITELKGEAEKQLKIAADYIEKCGYHRRDEELAELQAVLRGKRKFAELPPRV